MQVFPFSAAWLVGSCLRGLLPRQAPSADPNAWLSLLTRRSLPVLPAFLLCPPHCLCQITQACHLPNTHHSRFWSCHFPLLLLSSHSYVFIFQQRWTDSPNKKKWISRDKVRQFFTNYWVKSGNTVGLNSPRQSFKSDRTVSTKRFDGIFEPLFDEWQVIMSLTPPSLHQGNNNIQQSRSVRLHCGSCIARKEIPDCLCEAKLWRRVPRL